MARIERGQEGLCLLCQLPPAKMSEIVHKNLYITIFKFFKLSKALIRVVTCISVKQSSNQVCQICGHEPPWHHYSLSCILKLVTVLMSSESLGFWAAIAKKLELFYKMIPICIPSSKQIYWELTEIKRFSPTLISKNGNAVVTEKKFLETTLGLSMLKTLEPVQRKI